jgi:5-methylcytosine-specific restriction endonuclease McrA
VKICSTECRTNNGRMKSKKYAAANDNRDHTPKPCAECGEMFTTSYGDLRSVYCSDACGRRRSHRAARKKERARLRGVRVETVDPIKVFERDRWRCQICKSPTPPSLRGSYDDRAPELDHIMPLSLGGAHSYLNTQCACRRCNREKSNVPPAQPSLFAFAA